MKAVAVSILAAALALPTLPAVAGDDSGENPLYGGNGLTAADQCPVQAYPAVEYGTRGCDEAMAAAGLFDWLHGEDDESEPLEPQS